MLEPTHSGVPQALLRFLYASPVCFHTGPSSKESGGQVLVLHLERLPSAAPATQSRPVPAVATARALEGITTAAFSSTLTTGGHAAAPGARAAAAAPQGAPQQPPNMAVHHQLAAMLFEGPALIAQYSWPMPEPSSSSSTHVTAALVLPPVHQACLRQLVLVEQHLVPPSWHQYPHSPQRSSSSTAWAPPGSNVRSSNMPAVQGTCQAEAADLVSAAFVRLPLLFLPAGAAQEVEALLVPAMRQEAAAAAAAAADESIPTHPVDPTSRSSSSNACQPHPDEHAASAVAWQHWSELADDVGRVLDLCKQLQHHLGRLQKYGVTYMQPHPPPTADDSSSSSSSSNSQSSSPATAAAVAAVSAVGVSSTQLLLGELLPGVLGFLQQQGLHQCCAALLAGLPPHLVGPWWHQQQQQQQQEMQGPAEEEEQQQQQQQQQEMQGPAEEEEQQQQQWPPGAMGTQGDLLLSSAAASGAGRSCSMVPGGRQGAPTHAGAHAVAVARAPPAAAGSVMSREALPGVVGPGPFSGDSSSSACAGSSSKCVGSSSGAPDPSAALAGGACRAPLPEVTWVTPWRLFPGDTEQQYLHHKHVTYLWCDRYIAWFVILYLAVLFARMVWERSIMGTATYMYFILCKGAPYVPLMRGNIDLFIRDRERSITWTYQWLCMAPIVLGAVFCDEHAVMQPHLGRAVSSTGTAVARCLRQLHQTHAARAAAQLLQPAAEVLLGPRLFRMVCYQGPPAAAAAVGGAMAYLHAARGVLCRILQVPESPIRAFWRLRGEVLVNGIMPIPQNVRLPWHVPAILVEVAGMVYVFGMVFPMAEVLARYLAALTLSIVLAWWWDVTCRRQYIRHLQQQAAAQQAALAQKLGALGGAAAAGACSSGAAAHT